MILSWAWLMTVATLIQAIPAYGDGGIIQLQRQAGPYIITVFTSPTPVRVGPVDLSVMIQNRDDPHPLLDVEVLISLQRENGWVVSTRATREQAQNKLLYAAIINLPEAGQWQVKVDVQQGTESVSVAGVIRVAPSQSLLLSYWRWLTLPPLAIILFAGNQMLKHRLRSRSRNRG